MKIRKLSFLLPWLLTAALTGCVSNDSVEDKQKSSADHQPVTTTVASADGSKITYGTLGAGEPAIVFIHCWTCNHHFWDQQLDYFSQQRKVIWLDLAGQGDSGSQRKTYSMAAFGQDVATVVKQIGAKKVILVGHSMGGPVALEAAKLLGNQVTGIVGVDTFYTPFEYPTSQEKIDAFVKPFETDFYATSEGMVRSMFTPQADKTQVEAIVQKFASAKPEVGISAMHELFNWNASQVQTDLKNFAEILYNINAAPTGKEKPVNDHIVMVPGVGHFIAQMKPDVFNQTLEGIVSRLQQR